MAALSCAHRGSALFDDVGVLGWLCGICSVASNAAWRGDRAFFLFGDAHIEVRPVDLLLVVRNVDKPGIVGKLGTILGDHGVNIANMSLSRADCGELALTICELDQEPANEVLRLLEKFEQIQTIHLRPQKDFLLPPQH